MQIILARPFDDNDIVEVYMVQHKTKTDFQHDWDKAKIATVKKEPQTWAVDQVIERLEKQGWQILRCDTETVLY